MIGSQTEAEKYKHSIYIVGENEETHLYSGIMNSIDKGDEMTPTFTMKLELAKRLKVDDFLDMHFSVKMKEKL